jgi:hypothetical protein
MADLDFNKLRQEFEAAPDKFQTELFKLYARNRIGPETVRAGSLAEGFSRYPDDLKKALEGTYGEARAAVETITKTAVELHKSRNYTAENLKDLQEKIEAYKGPLIYVDGPYSDINAVKQAMTGWKPAVQRAPEPPKAAPAQGTFVDSASAQRAEAVRAGLAPSDIPYTRTPEYQRFTAYIKNGQSQDYAVLAGLAEKLLSKIKEDSPAALDTALRGVKDLPMPDGGPHWNDLTQADDRLNFFDPAQIQQVLTYARQATTYTIQQAGLEKVEAAKHEAERLNSRAAPISAEPSPVDLDNPESVLKAIFNAKVDEPLLNRGIDTLNNLARQVHAYHLVEIDYRHHASALPELLGNVQDAKTRMQDLKNRYAEIVESIQKEYPTLTGVEDFSQSVEMIERSNAIKAEDWPCFWSARKSATRPSSCGTAISAIAK